METVKERIVKLAEILGLLSCLHDPVIEDVLQLGEPLSDDTFS